MSFLSGLFFDGGHEDVLTRLWSASKEIGFPGGYQRSAFTMKENIRGHKLRFISSE